MFGVLSRQAVKAVRRPGLLLSSSTTSCHVLSLQAPHSRPPSYDMIARRFSSSQVDPQAYITHKLQEEKKRVPKRITSYSKITIPEASQILGFWIDSLSDKAVAAGKMLEQCKSLATVESRRDEVKKRVYDNIVKYIEVEGYPTSANPDFNVANINDLVYIILRPILSDFKRKTGRDIRLRRQKEIISVDSEIGGEEEFVMIDLISVEEETFILVTEAKQSSFGQAMKQCMLAMKDMRDRNGVGEVYGFVTTGEIWQMLSYGSAFQMSHKMSAMFDGVRKYEGLWMAKYSMMVDCIYAVLSNGGIAK